MSHFLLIVVVLVICSDQRNYSYTAVRYGKKVNVNSLSAVHALCMSLCVCVSSRWCSCHETCFQKKEPLRRPSVYPPIFVNTREVQSPLPYKHVLARVLRCHSPGTRPPVPKPEKRKFNESIVPKRRDMTTPVPCAQSSEPSSCDELASELSLPVPTMDCTNSWYLNTSLFPPLPMPPPPP